MSSEPTGFLYPFIESEERDSSAPAGRPGRIGPGQDGREPGTADGHPRAVRERLEQAAAAMAERFRPVGGSSPSATAGAPPTPKGPSTCSAAPRSGRPLPAMSLVDDRAVLTALANDVGFDLVFSRQIIAHARAGDIAIGFSTSGDSVNVLAGLGGGARRGLLTVGFCGYEGGAMAASDAIAHCLVVRSESVHRIQEAQDALMLQLWSMVQAP